VNLTVTMQNQLSRHVVFAPARRQLEVKITKANYQKIAQ
jgi:hypothetical protein